MGMMTVRMRHTRSHTRMRRSHHALEGPALSRCSHCGQEKFSHAVCFNCGWYNGRQVINVFARLDKKERKQKQKELEKAGEESESKRPLDAKELSRKS